MQARLRLAVAGWLVLASFGAEARGADAEVAPAADAEARQAFERAELAYRAGELAVALGEMEKAYELSQRAELLYNRARIEEDLGACAAARDHYRQYLQRVPEGEAREEAENAELRLVGRCPETPAMSVPPPPAVMSLPPPVSLARTSREAVPVAVADHGSTQRWLGWSILAGGVVAGVGAAYFLDAAIDSRNALQAAVNAEEAGGPRHDPELRSRQHRDLRAARVLGVSSAALVVGGALVVLLAPTESGGGRRAAVQLQPGLVAATYAQSF